MTHDAPPRNCRKRPSASLKRWIREAQNGKCLSCKKELEALEFDHVIPLGLGGDNRPENWAALCRPCHRTKTRDDVRRMAKAARQRRFHETGRSRAPSTSWKWLGARSFARDARKCVNGVIIRGVECDCPVCSGIAKDPEATQKDDRHD